MFDLVLGENDIVLQGSNHSLEFLYLDCSQSDFNKIAIISLGLLVLFEPGFELGQVDGLGMFANQNVNNLLFEVVLHVLFVEPA
jgi:hypothetical protein